MNRLKLIKRRAKLLRQVERGAHLVETPELELDQVEVQKPAAAIPDEPGPEMELVFE